MALCRKTIEEKTAGEPGTLRRLSGAYLEQMEAAGYSESTVNGRIWYLLRFIDWCEERSLQLPTEVTPAVMERYLKHVAGCRTRRSGRPFARGVQIALLSAVREFFKWLAKRGLVLFNPALELEMPRRGRTLPRNVLSAAEAERILCEPDITEPLGIRDRTILELLYSTGMRRFELCNLEISDIDIRQGTVFIREGKGRKDRIIPAGERSLRWVEKYLADSRPVLVSEHGDDGHLFLTVRGAPLKTPTVSHIVSMYRERAGIEKAGSSHMFRHTAATLMLENGADVRYVQQMLGHDSLQSTQVYTHVSIRKLKEVHARTHPARFRRRDRDRKASGEPGA